MFLLIYLLDSQDAGRQVRGEVHPGLGRCAGRSRSGLSTVVDRPLLPEVLIPGANHDELENQLLTPLLAFLHSQVCDPPAPDTAHLVERVRQNNKIIYGLGGDVYGGYILLVEWFN